ncbi:MAG: NAD(P)H-binding protein [Ferruginibacter sp.]|nr:NAD(P)H-binding protein [Ferruginibacter sp.]
MKIIVTGSVGNISKPLTTALVQKGHAVTVISSKPEKQKDIEALGATAAIGSLEDVDFLAATFTGADAVYCMVPPNNYFDHNIDLIAYYGRLGNNYAEAIQRSGVKHVVNLSTIGAHLEKGSGILLGAHNVEQVLNELSSNITITHIRPTSFYYNLYGYADLIKAEGFIAANYGTDNKIPWVSPIDIAAAITEEITRPFAGRKVRYVASEELTGNETARILGAAIGKPDLKWILISGEQMQNALNAAGMNPQIAAGLVEMYASLHSGLLAEDYYRNKPAVMGKVKLTDFAKEFAAAFKQK